MTKGHINRFNWTDEKVRKTLDAIRNNKKTSILKRFKITRKGDTLMFQGLPIVPASQVEGKIKAGLQGAGPIGIETLFFWLKEKYHGIPRREIAKYMKSLESYQKLKSRPAVHKKKYLYRKEGVTNTYLRKGTTWGVDLIQPTKGAFSERIKEKFVMVIVDQKTSFCWAKELDGGKSARNCLKVLKWAYNDAKKNNYPLPKVCTSDQGKEFLSVFSEWCKTMGIKRVWLKLVASVESRNSVLQRILAQMIGGYNNISDFPEALRKSVVKLNNTRSRITGLRPAVAITRKKITRKERVLRKGGDRVEQPKYEVGDLVRAMTALSSDKNQFYKSYLGLAQDKSRWGQPAKIKQRKKFGGLYKYKVRNAWKFSHELQKVIATQSIRPPPRKPEPVKPKGMERFLTKKVRPQPKKIKQKRAYKKKHLPPVRASRSIMRFFRKKK